MALDTPALVDLHGQRRRDIDVQVVIWPSDWARWAVGMKPRGAYSNAGGRAEAAAA